VIHNTHWTLCLLWSDTILVTSTNPISITRCILVTGGGQFRYVIYDLIELLLIWLKESLEIWQPGAKIIPVIISSDKTQLTLFCNIMAYPVYMTIGNIPKNICHKPSRLAHILIAYIPTSKLLTMTDKSAWCRAVGNLFHTCMRNVLCPIAKAGKSGVPMMSGNSVWYCCHLIFANFVGNYPEQGLVTCTFFGRCPKCIVTVMPFYFLRLILSGAHYHLVLIFRIYLVLPAFAAYRTSVLTW